MSLNQAELVKKFRTRRFWLLKLVAKFGRKCWYCQKPLKFTEMEIDHIVPRCRGGEWKLDNLAISCKPCNRAKGVMTLREFLMWLMLPKKPVDFLIGRSRTDEAIWMNFGPDIEEGLRVISPKGTPSSRRRKSGWTKREGRIAEDRDTWESRGLPDSPPVGSGAGAPTPTINGLEREQV